jgi:hypothetical protein
MADYADDSVTLKHGNRGFCSSEGFLRARAGAGPIEKRSPTARNGMGLRQHYRERRPNPVWRRSIEAGLVLQFSELKSDTAI